MPLEFTCPKCDSPLRLANTGLAGKKIRCPKCSEVITVPEPKEELAEPEELETEAEAEAEAPPPRGGRSSGVTTGKPKPRHDEDEGDEEPRPRSRRGRPEPAKGNSTLMWVLIGVGGFVVLCGGCVTVVIVMMNQAVNTLKDAVDKEIARENANEAGWAEQWERNKVYQVPNDGLTLKSRLKKTDDKSKFSKTTFEKVFQVQMTAGTLYTIRANARVKLDFKTKGGMDPTLRLENAAGNQLAFNDDEAPGNLDSRIDFQCPQDGVYKVVVSHIGTNIGDFTLKITKKEAPKGEPDQWQRGRTYDVPGGAGLKLTSRLAATDERSNNSYQKVFQVRMNAKTKYTIRMNAAPEQKKLDPMLRVENAAGNELAFNDDAPGEITLNARIDFTCPQDGVYRIIAINRHPNAGGDFTLTIVPANK